MEVECFKIRLKPDSLSMVREWAARLNSEMPEVKKLLANEGVQIESVFLEEGTEGAFLIYYLRSPDLKRARAVAHASQHPIDLFHRQVMKTVAAGAVQLECLLDASAD